MSDGELAIDEYQLLSCIATGTYSQVWEVKENEGSEHFAMKLLLPETLFDPDQMKMFKLEGKVGQAFDHPNFVKLHKFTANKKRAYLIMDFFRAPNLKTLIQNDLTAVQMRISKLFESACAALGHMHEKGWVHKDVKPDNILFSKGSELRLIDFSLSGRIVSGLGKLFAGKIQFIQGTRTYIAPETIRKQHAVPQTDMYSLGVTIYEVLTGLPPFSGTSPDELLRKHIGEPAPAPSELNPNVTPEMDKLVLRMLAKKPAQRFADMNELYAEFRTLSVFQEDVKELADRNKQAGQEDFEDGLSNRLDSRSDAARGGRQYEGASEDVTTPKQKKPVANKPAPAVAGQPKQPRSPRPPAAPQPMPQPPPPVYQPPQPVAYQPPMVPPQPVVYQPPQPVAYQPPMVPPAMVVPPAPQPQYIPQPVQGMAVAPPHAPRPTQPATAPPQAQPGQTPPGHQTKSGTPAATPQKQQSAPAAQPRPKKAQPQPTSPPAAAKPKPTQPSPPKPAAASKQQENDDDLPPMDIDDLIVS